MKKSSIFKMKISFSYVKNVYSKEHNKTGCIKEKPISYIIVKSVYKSFLLRAIKYLHKI